MYGASGIKFDSTGLTDKEAMKMSEWSFDFHDVIWVLLHDMKRAISQTQEEGSDAILQMEDKVERRPRLDFGERKMVK